MQRDTQRAIEWDCSRTLIRFYDHFDQWNYEAMAGLYTPDGSWHRAGKELIGRAAIVAELEPRSRTQTVRHVLTNILVQARDAEHADFRSLLTAYQYDDGKKSATAPVISAPYLLLVVSGEMVRAGEDWLIAKQVSRREFAFTRA